MDEAPVIKAFVRDGIYVRTRHMDEEAKVRIRKRFSRHFFKKEKVCQACEYFEERVSDICLDCPNYVGQTVLYKIVRINGKPFVRLPFGDRRGVKSIFGKRLKFIDKNPTIPMVRPIKFVGELRKHQIGTTEVLEVEERGVLKSPPRSGKTVMSAHTICHLGVKTIIMASQREWLVNFYKTFVGSEKEERMTNIKLARIGFARKLEDFEKYDICLCTYQTFIKESGQKLLQKIKKKFTAMFVDEIQKGNALEFSKVINTFHCKYKFGLSGTPERKDQKEWIMERLIGPIIHDVKVERLVPRVMAVKSKLGGKLPTMWTYAISRIEKDPDRMDLVARLVVTMVNRGHMVLIPMARVEAIDMLVKKINDEWEGPKKIAYPFHGKVKKKERDTIVERASEYKIKVLVGQTSLLSTGINIPRASCLIEYTPSSNLPNADQRFSRILTPMDGKPQPTIVYILDDNNIRRSCMRNEYYQCLLPKFRPRMTPETREKIAAYLKAGTRKKPAKVGRYF